MHALLLIDGTCGLCSACAAWIARRDQGQTLRIHAYQEFDAARLAQWGLTATRCETALHLITETNRVWRGALAVNAVLWRLRGWRWLAILLAVCPPLLLAEMLLYRLVARHRTRLSRWLGLTACRVETQGVSSSSNTP